MYQIQWLRLPDVWSSVSAAANPETGSSCALRKRSSDVRDEGAFGPYSMSKDCIVFSISSAAMSEVDWMPWIFSLNSSGFDARRSASS
jgi:hypothetical protein